MALHFIALQPWQSSLIKEVGFDPATCEATLVFRDNPGVRYHYPDVAHGDIASVLFAESIGKAARAVICKPWGQNFTKATIVPTPELPEIINVVFDGPPGPEAGRFVEVEDGHGKSFKAGEWSEAGGGNWNLCINLANLATKGA